MTTDTLDFPPLDAAMVPEPATELVDVAEIRGGQAIVKLSATEAGLAALRADLHGKTYDLTTTKGDKEARADRKRCVDLRAALERRRKELKAPALEFGRLIDAEAKRISGAIEVIEAPIDWQIKADEDRREAERQEKARKEAERVGKLQAGVETIRGYVAKAQAPGMTAERISRGILALEEMEFLPDAWSEFTAAAAQARDESLTSLRTLHAGAVERESEAARLAAEKAELDRRAAELVALEAESKARSYAENAAQVSPPPAVPLSAAEPPRQEEAGDAGVAPEFTEGQEPQQVLKAEPATADATDRGTPAMASPRGGAMGAGQAAAAAPAGEPATLKLGTICDRIGPGFTMTAAFVSDTLGVQWVATDKAAKLYRESQFALICRALAKHLQDVSEAVEA